MLRVSHRSAIRRAPRAAGPPNHALSTMTPSSFLEAFSNVIKVAGIIAYCACIIRSTKPGFWDEPVIDSSA